MSAAGGRPSVNLASVGLKVLRATSVRDKVAWTLETWETLQHLGQLGAWPPMGHLSDADRRQLQDMPTTQLPGAPTSALRSLTCTQGDWHIHLDMEPVDPSSIPDHPGRPDKPKLVSGAEFDACARSA